MRRMELMRVGEVAEALAVNVDTVRRWLDEGKLRGVLLPSGRWRVPRAEVDRILMTGERGGE